MIQEAPDSSQGRHIHKVTVRLLPLWPDRPGLWFPQAEAKFNLASVTSDMTKYNYVVPHLEQTCGHGRGHLPFTSGERALHHPQGWDSASVIITWSTSPPAPNPRRDGPQAVPVLTPLGRAWRRTCQKISWEAYGPAVYQATSRPYWLAKPRATWTPPHNWPTGSRKLLRFPPQHIVRSAEEK